jgi:hypothetical protein
MALLPRPLKQMLWFVGLWAAGVASVAVVAGALRFVLNAATG